MKSARLFLNAALFVGYVWAVGTLFYSLSPRSGLGMCSARLLYLFLDNFMFVSVSVLPIVVFALISLPLLIPIVKKLTDEKITAVALSVSFFMVAFLLFAHQNKDFNLKDFTFALVWSTLSAFGAGAIAYFLYKGLFKRLFNLLIVPALAANVLAMPFLMKSMHAFYIIKKTKFSFALLGNLIIYLLPFAILFLIFLVWFKSKPKVVALLGWLFLVISVLFTALQPILYTGPDIKCEKTSEDKEQSACIGNKPNFLFIVADALRPDVLVPYGGKISTPNISEFANKSFIFENVYSATPWTLPSITSFFSGLYPSAHGVNQPQDNLDASFDTIIEILKQNGYFTWAVIEQYLYGRYQHIMQNFKTFHIIQCHPCYVIFSHPLIKKLERAGLRSLPLCHRQTTKVALDSAIAIERSCRPFFGWIHILDPHMPLTPPKEFRANTFESKERTNRAHDRKKAASDVLDRSDIGRGRRFVDSELISWIWDLYLAEVRYVDHEIARIFSALKETGLWDKTVVIFTADHGEEIFERNSYNHGHTLYNEVLHVPLIIHIPNIDANFNQRIQTRVRTIDIAPTILELANVEYKPDSFQGKSLIPLINGAYEQDREVLAELSLYGEKKAIFMGQYKLICEVPLNRCQLFDLNEDPKELYPIKGNEEIKRQMLKRLDELLASSATIYERITGKPHEQTYKLPSHETIEQLKALGYVD